MHTDRHDEAKNRFRNFVNVLKKPCGSKVGYMSPARNSWNARVIVNLPLQHSQCYYVTEVDGTFCHHKCCRFSPAWSSAYVVTFRIYRDKYVYVNIRSTKILSDMPHIKEREARPLGWEKVTNLPSVMVTRGTYGAKNDTQRVWVEKS